MAASVEVHVFHGPGPFAAGAVGTDITSTTVRFKKADNDTADANNPVVIPTSGHNYSWRKSFKIAIDTGGTLPDNKISNLRFFSGLESLGTDRVLLVNQTSSYTQASASDEGSAISAVDVDTKTVGSPQVVNAGTVIENGTHTIPTSGDQDFIEMQLKIGSTATVGSSAAAKTLFYRYDET